MECIRIIKINTPESVTLLEAGYLLEKNAVSHPIRVLNWERYQYLPKVSFRIGHIGNKIWLKYYVTEKHVRAMETRINGSVYKDSCVEFFISLDGENYYNLEFNCIGVAHLAYGPERNKRKFVDTESIEKIEIQSSLGNKPFDTQSGNFEWEMMICIPIESFTFSNIENLSNVKASANFYKCGDEMPIPHYVSWNPVKTENPDFHCLEYFGKVFFE
jgi:hypothetical protein